MRNKSRTGKFFYNSLSAAILQIVIMLTGLINPRIMLQYYGSEINGLIASVTQFITYFTLVEAGIGGSAIYALYKPLAEKNFKAINGVISATKKYYEQAGIIFLILVILLSIIYPFFIKSQELSQISVGLLILIIGVTGSLEFFSLSKYRVLLSADQNLYLISIASIAQTILSTVIIIISALLGANIVLLKGLTITAILIRLFILSTYIKKHYKYLDYREIPQKNALSNRWNVLYLQILQSSQYAAPIILATIFTDLRKVSVFSIYNMVLIGINGILSIFVSGLSASFGDVIARKEIKVLRESFCQFEFSYYSIITIVYATALVTIMPFIRIYTVGIVDVNYDLPILGFLFVLNGWLYNVKTPQGMLVISAGLFKETRIQSTIQAVIIIIFGVILAPTYGLVGIMIASCLSNLYRDIDLLFFIPKNVTGLPIRDTLFRIIRMVFEGFVIWFAFSFIHININTYPHWFLFTGGVFLLSTLIVIIFSLIFDGYQFRSVIKSLQNIVM